MTGLAQLLYLAAAGLFIAGLKMLSSPTTARRGNTWSALGMLLAVVSTLLEKEVISYQWIALGIALGGGAGAWMARSVVMTAMPQMVALLNGFGGLASLLVAWAAYVHHPNLNLSTAASVVMSVLIGGVTFSGSMVAWAKLDGRIPGKSILFRGQKPVNLLLLGMAVLGGGWFAWDAAGASAVFPILIGLALVLGVLAVIPVGGADMPVVISLLNSFSGLAACATGFLLGHHLLIVTGSLVGASGLILTRIMCIAMNRSLANVMLGGLAGGADPTKAIHGTSHPISIQDTYVLLEAARSVVVVPGYGLAVAQAQHVLRELGDLLEKNGTEVRYAIHPVAGRMPGHMNVLLAEASVPYEQLSEMESVNPGMPGVDVCLVIGANDVVNPAAREDPASPIYGMPIIEADRARTVVVLKRSMAAGFAGIDNPLFVRPNTRMLFGDAKASLQGLVGEFKGR